MPTIPPTTIEMMIKKSMAPPVPLSYSRRVEMAREEATLLHLLEAGVYPEMRALTAARYRMTFQLEAI